MTAEVDATDVVQKAAAPIAFIAIVAGACLAAVALIRRFGSQLPLPDYMVDFIAPDVDDEDQDDEDESTLNTAEQW